MTSKFTFHGLGPSKERYRMVRRNGQFYIEYQKPTGSWFQEMVPEAITDYDSARKYWLDFCKVRGVKHTAEESDHQYANKSGT